MGAKYASSFFVHWLRSTHLSTRTGNTLYINQWIRNFHSAHSMQETLFDFRVPINCQIVWRKNHFTEQTASHDTRKLCWLIPAPSNTHNIPFPKRWTNQRTTRPGSHRVKTPYIWYTVAPIIYYKINRAHICALKYTSGWASLKIPKFPVFQNWNFRMNN